MSPIRHTLPAGIRENICRPESTIPLEWLQAHGIDCVGSIIDSAEPEVWARAQGVIEWRHMRGISTHLVWNSESAGTGAWPAPLSAAEEIYINRWRRFLEGCPPGAVISATAGNEGTTPGWVDTDGEPITLQTMVQTARAFAPVCVEFGVEPWATSIHTDPQDAIELARAVRGLVVGVPYHPYYRALRGQPSTPEENILGNPNEWRFGTVEAVADLFIGEYPDDVDCMFDELGCPTIYDGIGEAGQAHFVEGCILLDHPKIARLLYFGGPRGVVPDAEIAEGKDWYIIGQPQGLAEAAFVNPRPDGGGGEDPTVWDGRFPVSVWQAKWQETLGPMAEYHHDFGIPKFWRGHGDDGIEHWRDLGPAMWPEEIKEPHETDTNDDGSPVEVRFMGFAGGVVRWDPRTGATLV